MVRRDPAVELRLLTEELHEYEEQLRLREDRMAREEEERIRQLVEARRSRPGFATHMQQIGLLLINVRDEEGMSFKVLVFISEEIFMVKMQIDIMKRIPWEQQTLLFRGQELEDGRTVADYNLEDDSEINIVVRSNQP